MQRGLRGCEEYQLSRWQRKVVRLGGRHKPGGLYVVVGLAGLGAAAKAGRRVDHVEERRVGVAIRASLHNAPSSAADAEHS